MKSLTLALVVAALLALPLVVAAQTPVVVELFTSEGCSSCPPADALLVELSHAESAGGPPVIVLGEHVDYWNYIGWTDRFSSHEFTQRQEAYARRFHLASAYTPQMVIDGREQIVGNDKAGVGRYLAAATAQPKPANVSLSRVGDHSLQIAVRSSGAGKAQVLLAVTEDNLSSSVRSGENSGHTLHHAGVVRSLRPIGWLSNGSFEAKVDIPGNKDWNPANLKLVVLVQQPDDGPIVGAAVTPYR